MYSFLTPFRTKNLIRIGSKNDGGYIIRSKILNDIEGVLSFGIYYNWDFEKDLISSSKVKKMILADPYTPIASIKDMVKLRGKLNRDKNTIEIITTNQSRLSGRIYYIFKKTKLYVSKYFQFNWFLLRYKDIVRYENLGLESYTSSKMRTIDYFISTLAISKNLLFKMDIEGSEYSLDFSNKIFQNVLCLLIEFHDIEKNYDRLKTIIKELQKNNLYIFHVHLNNSSELIEGTTFSKTIEVSFQQRHYFGDSLEKSNLKYPITGIDNPCDPGREDYALNFN